MDNLEIISTGGGCQGLYLPHPLGRTKAGYFLITNIEGDNLPIKGEKAILGWYSDESEFLTSYDIIF
jgi:hypothetical protein